MNTRQITKYMLLVLLFLIVVIALSLLFKEDNEDEEDLTGVNTDGSYVSEEEITLNNFSNLFSYFESFDEGVKVREEICNELIKYQTPVKNFDTVNEKIENGMLSFTLVSMDEISDEEYMVSITANETIIARSK